MPRREAPRRACSGDRAPLSRLAVDGADGLARGHATLPGVTFGRAARLALGAVNHLAAEGSRCLSTEILRGPAIVTACHQQRQVQGPCRQPIHRDVLPSEQGHARLVPGHVSEEVGEVGPGRAQMRRVRVAGRKCCGAKQRNRRATRMARASQRLWS